MGLLAFLTSIVDRSGLRAVNVSRLSMEFVRSE